MTDQQSISFEQLGLPDFLLQSLQAVGYENPTPIQAQAIPVLLEGHDIVGQAQTGTGKTAAFALPIMSMVDVKQKQPQALVLAPTRELALQVAEAFQSYAKNHDGFHILPVYGGQSYNTQIRALKRGVQVVVGTPGRVMDHIRQGTLKLDAIKMLVLDEADEMLRMGFIEDVEWILDKSPEERQIALFSATMPKQIKRIATRYLNQPKEIAIKVKTETAATIRQRVWMVSGLNKLDALTRIIECEDNDGMIIFVRTKHATEELATKLQSRGYAAAALNGDMVQKVRERTVMSLKDMSIDIIVATDIAARGLDVERITHVINYDIPYDTEAYVHRIGRTGRAGRKGEAILFAAPRERRMLKSIERATRQKIEEMQLPTREQMNNLRIERFKEQITSARVLDEEQQFYQDLINTYQEATNVPAIEIAATLARMVNAKDSLMPRPPRKQKEKEDYGVKPGGKGDDSSRKRSSNKGKKDYDIDMESFRIEVGHEHGVAPKHIVGAIANEAGVESQYIGHINILDAHSMIDLPAGMPKDIFMHLKKTRVLGHPLNITRSESGNGKAKGKPEGKSKPQGGKKPGAKAKRDKKPGTKRKRKDT